MQQLSGVLFALYAFALAYKGIIDRRIPVHTSWEVKGSAALAWGVFCLALGGSVTVISSK